ncbi:hypothetical protein [Iningainema tapete]|nr:hypothetical protein [Iningainema tapete]
MTLVWFFSSYVKTQQALRWWSDRQSMKLFAEAEKIRDDLLQESFTIRRNLELLPVESLELSFDHTQECLNKINNFHLSLAQLSDRLFSAYLPEGLPLAIELLLQPWVASHPHIYFKMDVPSYWRDEPAERCIVILSTLEELLRITLPQVLTQISIYINLKQQENIRQLLVEITYPDESTLEFHSNIPELGYLSDSFRVLTSGKCFCRNNNLSVAWYFFW